MKRKTKKRTKANKRTKVNKDISNIIISIIDIEIKNNPALRNSDPMIQYTLRKEYRVKRLAEIATQILGLIHPDV